MFAGRALCKYSRALLCLWGWKWFYLQALALGSARELVAWELFFTLFGKLVDNCLYQKWFCDAVKVCGCWQKVNSRICSGVTQQSLSTGCGTGRVTLLGAAGSAAAARLPTTICLYSLFLP